MIRPQRELPVVYLKPGEIHIAEHPTLIITVLGSCLAVTMFSRRTGHGAMCHGLLPKCKGERSCCGGCLEKFRFVDCSIEQMVKMFDKLKIKRRDIEVKVFGGSDMFSREIKIPGLVSIGRQNVQTAELVLQREGLAIAKMDVGGLQGRKILFYTDTGDVLLKRLTKVNDPDIQW
ncbi:MAG TPA: chemotaxis protein CheD [Nitrospirota bacterium]